MLHHSGNTVKHKTREISLIVNIQLTSSFCIISICSITTQETNLADFLPIHLHCVQKLGTFMSKSSLRLFSCI